MENTCTLIMPVTADLPISLDSELTAFLETADRRILQLGMERDAEFFYPAVYRAYADNYRPSVSGRISE